MAIMITTFSQKREIKFSDTEFFKFRENHKTRSIFEQITKPREK